MITQKLPRATNWGHNNDFSSLKDRKGRSLLNLRSNVRPTYYTERFESTDLVVVLKAIQKTTERKGEEHAGKIGGQLRALVEQSCSYTGRGMDKDKKAKLRNAFVEELGITLGKVLGEATHRQQRK